MKKRKLKKKTVESHIPDDQEIHVIEPEPKFPKGKPTFSVIDGDTQIKDTYSFRNLAKELIETLDRDLEITINDDRDPPVINMDVNPTPINVNVDAPVVNVPPTPVEVRVPTQRIPDFPKPEVTVNNNINLRSVLILGYFIVMILFAIFGALIWLSLT